jgi:rod shape determining protein RodA
VSSLIDRFGAGPPGRRQMGFLGYLRRFDVVLLATTLTLTCVGLVMIYSATRTAEPGNPTYYVKRQAVFAVLAVLTLLVTMLVDYRRIEEWAWVIYGLSIAALVGVRVIGTPGSLGAQREINLGVLSIQPSEFAVLALIIAVAQYLHHREAGLSPRVLVRLLLLCALPMGLVYLQPDLGTTMIMAIVVFGLLLMAGFRLRLLIAIAVVVVGGFLFAVNVHILHGYQLERITGFLHQPAPGDCFSLSAAQQSDCYQLAQSKIAIGAGGLTGTGLFKGAETSYEFVPYAYADFIFSAIGEQLGFLGEVVILGLYALLCFRVVRAMQLARDSFGRLVCGGALMFAAFSVFQNVGMTIGIMPITGIPLPFISYGGSALFAMYAAVGLVMNVELRRGGFR